MIDYKAKRLTSATYITLLGFYLLFQISFILHAYSILPLISTSINGWDTWISPVSLFLMFLYLCYCCVLFILGAKMKLRSVGYVGIAIMTFTILYEIIASIYPFYSVIYNEYGYYTGATVMSIITLATGLIELVGVLLFLLGTCTSVAMKILTPAYLLFALIVSLILFPLGDNLEWDYPITRTIVSVIDITVICAMLLPPYLLWNKKK